MHFSSLILVLATAAVALATPTPAKRVGYYLTFFDVDAPTEGPVKVFPTFAGNAMPLTLSDNV